MLHRVELRGVLADHVFTGSPNEYGEIIAITVATISFIKIGIAIRGMIVSHKTRNPLDSSVKFVTFMTQCFRWWSRRMCF